MKKLMFATALVASVAAFADAAPTAINAVGFEGYALGYTPQTGETEKNEDETDKTEAGYGYFYFDGGEGGASNSSVVTNETPSTTETKRTAYFAEKTNRKFLALDTEGGTFWRCLNEISHSGDPVTYGLGAVTNVAATGTYLDTLVQFTVTEDDAPTTTADDKLAIWLGVVTNEQGEVTGTNLMVRAKAWSWVNEEINSAPVDFVIANSPVVAGEWYRLTVKAVQSVVDPNQKILPAFQIYIDGTAVAATTSPISTDLQTIFATAGEASIWMEGMADLAAANKLFPTLAEDPQYVTDVTLQGVGFQGTGAVDEIVWTEDDLFPAGGQTGIDFTLTWGEGVSAVKYVLSTDMTTTNDFTSGTAVQLAPGDGTATIELIPTFASNYEFDKVLMGEDVISSLTFPIPGVTTNATLYAKEEAPAYPTYVGEDAALKAQYDTWKGGKTVGDGESYEKQFLLNTATDTVVADDALQIDSITEVQGGWDIVVSTTVTGAALSDGSATTYNGYLLVKSADTLAGLEAATPASYTVTPAADGKVKITVTAGKFMKVVLTTTAPAQN